MDRLLASPRYGERMAVDWLDVARYADSFGFQVDRERDMWPWRDWVIRAFNENLPFDQFITWQLAGDLLPDATDEQILATAFNRLHQQETEGGSVEEEYRVEYVADRVQTVCDGVPRADVRVRALPRPQVRSHHAEGVLPALRDVPEHRRGRAVFLLHDLAAHADARAGR